MVRNNEQIMHRINKMETEYTFLMRDFLGDLKGVSEGKQKKWEDIEFILHSLIERKTRLTQLQQQISLLKWVLEEEH